MFSALNEQNQYVTEKIHLPLDHVSNKSAGDNLLGRNVIRSSRQEVLIKKGVLENFAKFTGKHLCQGLLFNKVTDLGNLLIIRNYEINPLKRNVG